MGNMMDNFTTVNKLVATEPFPSTQIKSTIKAGVALIEQTVQLTPLKVLYPENNGITPGSILWVPGEYMKLKWATDVFTAIDGTKFILVPVDKVVAYSMPEEAAV